MKSDKPRVLFITPLPPPVHGSAMVSQYIKDSLLVNEAFDCDFVNLSTSRKMDEIGKGGVRKLLRFVGAYFAVLGKLLTHRYALCYLAITCHDMGFLKDAPFVLLCKLFRRKVLIHQHNKGMSGCVDKWPYKWLLPLVYRNTTVMLLSWYLYEDISRVVSREQVVVCANGVPPLDNGQQSTDNGLLRDETISHTETKFAGRREKQFTKDTEFSCNAENICQRELDTNSQNARIASLVCGLRDEGFGLTQTLHDAAPVPSGVIACSDHELHGLHEYSGASATKIISHGCSRIDTDSRIASLACGHPDEDSRRLNENENVDDAKQKYLTQTDTDISCNAVEPSAPRLLFLSNLIESKGVYVLLDACKVLKERGLQLACDFVGGETKEIDRVRFETAIKERDLEGVVCYQGPKYGDEKERYLAMADVLVFPTYYYNECLPLVILEAMQHKLAVVSTTEGAIPDVVSNGVNGFVVERKNAVALADALEQLIANMELCHQMGEQGYARYKEHYTLEVFEKRFETLLREVSQH